MHRDELVAFLDHLLDVHSIQDFGPQGMQVEGKEEVRRVAVGVTASEELFRRAVEWGADAVICHHGMLWDFDPRPVRGPLKRRLQLLLDHGITLLGYHLVLDAHEEHGNNAILARALGLVDIQPFGDYRGTLLGRRGRFDPGLSHDALATRVQSVLGGTPLVFPFGPEPVRTLGVITGGAVNDFRQAIDAGLDAYLTGEVPEFGQETAREERVTYVSGGHYRTETFGVKSLGERLE
ncbi:MAG: Nif3-like dinuclear metal center hexameric protein, partial [Planctomycetota bacterium]